MYDPADQGFSPQMRAIDQCQMALLRTLSIHYGARLYLKGGMAMRALFGSLRLTKDIDFERDLSLSSAQLKVSVRKALGTAALAAALRAPEIVVTKHTATTLRFVLRAKLLTDEPVRYEVEISGRPVPPREHLKRINVVPPMTYRMTQFAVNTYDSHAMAAAKTAALHSYSRNVTRDIFDLSDLMAQGANPVELLVRKPVQQLRKMAGNTIAQVDGIGWARANEELLPYLPLGVREALDEGVWDTMRLHVAEKVDAWLAQALAEAARRDDKNQARGVS
jgi:predicted nucleotidyltransferase component of viral defense system